MHVIINQELGRVHHSTGNRFLQKTRPTYCWIPEEFFGENGFNKSRFLVSRWPSINCSANPLAVGSHVIPDLKKPVSPRSRCPILREFLTRLKVVAAIKTIQNTA